MCWNTIKVRFRNACQAVLVMLALSTGSYAAPARMSDTRPNILLAVSDDQSWLHTGASGDLLVKTPAFDRIAGEGVQFTNAYCAAPSCGPSRSAILTGQAIWRLEQAGNIHSTLPSKFEVYTDLLEEAGYFVGSTSKAWGPGRLEPGGRTRNPAGERFSDFDNFLGQIPEGQPFCFWLGSSDPHRPYKLGSGLASGKDLRKVKVPPNLPDVELVRSDILDYYVEIERFDATLARAIASLEKSGRLKNTLVVVTSDNGMPFPRAKASLYDFGTRMPMAVCWPSKIPGGRTIHDFVSLAGLAPTFLEAAGLRPPRSMTARSLMNILSSTSSGQVDQSRDRVFTAMERHDGCRKGGKGFPCRAMRTHDYLYIYNYEPSRWPSGDPNPQNCARAIPYGEIDSSPTKTFMMTSRALDGVARLAQLAFNRRTASELYDLRKDPGQLNNVAYQAEYSEITDRLHTQLMSYLRETGDPRALAKSALWDYYPYYGRKVTEGWSVDPVPDSHESAAGGSFHFVPETNGRRQLWINSPDGALRWRLRVPERVFCDEVVLVGHDIQRVFTPVQWSRSDRGVLSYTRTNNEDLNRTVRNEIGYSVRIAPKLYGADITLTFQNNGERALHNVVGHVCLSHLSTRFRDPHYDRTYIRREGSFLNLVETDRGSDPIRAHYLVRGYSAIRVFDNRKNRFWGPLSREEADDGLILTQSVDGTQLAALWFSPASELFQNSDEPNMCIHSDPFFGDIEPGQSKSVDGKLIVFTGSLEQFEKKPFWPIRSE